MAKVIVISLSREHLDFQFMTSMPNLPQSGLEGTETGVLVYHVYDSGNLGTGMVEDF